MTQAAGRARRLPALGAAVLTVMLPWAAAAAADPADPAVPLTLVLAEWKAGAFGRETAGYLAWVKGPGGALRVEILEPADRADADAAAGDAAGADARALSALLGRQGRGWTVVPGAGQEPGVLAPWDREWRPAPTGLGRLAGAVATATPGSRARLDLAAPSRVPDGDDGRSRRPGAAGNLRARLVERGRGGGGPGERLVVEGRQDGTVRIVSSRRPGALAIHPRPARQAAGDPASVFLPWWPLGELLGPAPAEGAEPGTSPGDAR